MSDAWWPLIDQTDQRYFASTFLASHGAIQPVILEPLAAPLLESGVHFNTVNVLWVQEIVSAK